MSGNEKNLKKFSEYDPERLQEISRKGGIASGQARQERKQLREELNALLMNGDVQQRLCTALIDKALSGDSKAFSIIRDTLGENPTKSLQLLTGENMDGFKEEHAAEIERLYLDEMERDIPRYGSLARDLIGRDRAREIAMDLMRTV